MFCFVFFWKLIESIECTSFSLYLRRFQLLHLLQSAKLMAIVVRNDFFPFIIVVCCSLFFWFSDTAQAIRYNARKIQYVIKYNEKCTNVCLRGCVSAVITLHRFVHVYASLLLCWLLRAFFSTLLSHIHFWLEYVSAHTRSRTIAGKLKTKFYLKKGNYIFQCILASFLRCISFYFSAAACL